MDQSLNDVLGSYGDKNSDARLAVEKYHSSTAGQNANIPRSSSRKGLGCRPGSHKDVTFNLRQKNVTQTSKNADKKHIVIGLIDEDNRKSASIMTNKRRNDSRNMLNKTMPLPGSN